MVKEDLEEQRPSRNETFEIKVMSDLAHLSDRKMKALLDEVGPRSEDLALAMQQADNKVIDRILANLSLWQTDRLYRGQPIGQLPPPGRRAIGLLPPAYGAAVDRDDRYRNSARRSAPVLPPWHGGRGGSQGGGP